MTGATGDVGGEVVRLLVAEGAEVHALHRRPEQASALVELGAEPVLGRLDDTSDLRRLMSGVDRLFLLIPPVAQQVGLERTLITAAESAHLQHVVRISAGDSNPRSPVPWAGAHARGDRRLAATDLDWTSVRPSAFMQNLASQAVVIQRACCPTPPGVEASAGSTPATWRPSPPASCSTGPRPTVARPTSLTGPESLTFADVAGRLTAGLGRRVRAVALPKPAYVALLRAAGVDAFMAHGLGAQFADVVRHNVDIDTTADVERLTGDAARTIDQWIEEHHDLF